MTRESTGRCAPRGSPDSTPIRSLKRTLFLWLLVPLALIVPAGAALQYWFSAQPAREAFDHALGDTALALANMVRDENGRIVFEPTPEAERWLRTDQTDVVYYALIDGDGRLVAGDAELLALATPGARPLAAGSAAFVDATIAGAPVRVALRGLACGARTCQVRVAETKLKRERLLQGAAEGAAVTMLLLVVALVLAIGVAVARALRPLDRVGHELATRSLEDLRPVHAPAPREIAPLVAALNRLFERLRDASLAQQAFLADAAHQLRTPLTSLKTETELALLEPHAPETDATLRRLNALASRGARLAGQLLSIARSDAAAVGNEPEAVDLKDVAAEAADEWVPQALAVGIDLGFSLSSAPIRGRRFLLRELIGNLVHNALEYAGAGSEVTVRTGTDSQFAVLEVEDNGPGIAPTERERAFERFYRASDAGGHGSGLGLAIVREIARGHGADVALLDPPSGKGLLVRLRFPAVTSPPAS